MAQSQRGEGCHPQCGYRADGNAVLCGMQANTAGCSSNSSEETKAWL